MMCVYVDFHRIFVLLFVIQLLQHAGVTRKRRLLTVTLVIVFSYDELHRSTNV